MTYKNNPVANAYMAMYEKKVVERASWVPEEITDEGAAEFMGAAANAAKKGDKTFKFGDKEYKVTMKKDTVDAITASKEVKEVAEPEAKGEKAFKDMHTDNTKKSGEQDDGTIVKENAAKFKNDKLDYDDQFRGRVSLSQTLNKELGFDPKKPWNGGVGFDNLTMYGDGKGKQGAILRDALSGKHTYADLLAAAKTFFGIK
jgi:hypothetical protein